MSRFKKALKAARAEHLRKLIENNQNNPRFLFNTCLANARPNSHWLGSGNHMYIFSYLRRGLWMPGC